MTDQKLKISKLYYAVDGTREPFEISFSTTDFPDLPLTGPIVAKGELMRVEEGVMLLLSELRATQTGPCVRCGKPLKQGLQFHPSEWLFYEAKPEVYDDENEALYLDKKQLEVDPFEPVRQELILNVNPAPHCQKPCATFKEPETGVKALSGLKKIL